MNDQSAGMEDGHNPVAAPGRPEPLILTDALPTSPSRAEIRRARRSRGRGRLSLTVILTLVVLAVFAGRVRPPAAVGQPFTKGGD